LTLSDALVLLVLPLLEFWVGVVVMVWLSADEDEDDDDADADADGVDDDDDTPLWPETPCRHSCKNRDDSFVML
jgi:hypothetical protein